MDDWYKNEPVEPHRWNPKSGRFVDQETPWAHLDIAGMAWNRENKDTCPVGAVGFGVATLYNLVNSDFPSEMPIDGPMKY